MLSSTNRQTASDLAADVCPVQRGALPWSPLESCISHLVAHSHGNWICLAASGCTGRESLCNAFKLRGQQHFAACYVVRITSQQAGIRFLIVAQRAACRQLETGGEVTCLQKFASSSHRAWCMPAAEPTPCCGATPVLPALQGCSHDALQDGSIFSTASQPGQREVSPEGTVLAYDERMLLHRDESARGSPHPERPDRIKAVMARLERAGLTGGVCLLCSCSPLLSQNLLPIKAGAMHQEGALSDQQEPGPVGPSGATFWLPPPAAFLVWQQGTLPTAKSN